MDDFIAELANEVVKRIKNNNVSSIPSSERLTRFEVKEQFKISYCTLHKLMKEGLLPYAKIGRKTIFKKEEVEAYFESKKRGGAKW